MEKLSVQIGVGDAGQRVDRYISDIAGLSRTIAQQLIEDDQVLVNGKCCSKSYKLAAGDQLEITVPPPKEVELLAQDIPLDIVYEDDALLVVDKPKGMVVHPAPGNNEGTLVNALMYHCAGRLSGIGGEIRPGIVHRIDKDTSGLLVVAKNDEAHQGLSQQFACHSIQRKYQAVVYGHFSNCDGEIDAPIGRSSNDRKKMAVTNHNSKRAFTTYHVVAEYPGFSHLALQLKTGRTHQIRVHMAHLGYPLAGDTVYGPRKAIKKLNGQCLHAGTLGFIHPITGEFLCFDSPLPQYFTSFLSWLSRHEGQNFDE